MWHKRLTVRGATLWSRRCLFEYMKQLVRRKAGISRYFTFQALLSKAPPVSVISMRVKQKSSCPADPPQLKIMHHKQNAEQEVVKIKSEF